MVNFFISSETNLKLIITQNYLNQIYISFASPYAAQIAFYFNKPHIAFTDTENAKLGIAAFLPFTNAVVTPKAFKSTLGKNHIKFDGYMENTYLHLIILNLA